MSRSTFVVDVVPAAASWGTAFAASYTVVGPASIDVGIYASLTLHVAVYQAPTGTLPTLDVMVQHSPDGVSKWSKLVQIPQIGTPIPEAEDGPPAWPVTVAITVPGPGTSDSQTFSRFLRVVLRTGGTTQQYTGSIHLVLRD